MGKNFNFLLEGLGRSQTVKDAQAAYNAIFEQKRQNAVKLRHIREQREQTEAEVACFLDDLKHITGLPLNSPLFCEIAAMTIDARLRRRKFANQQDTPILTEDW
jgi:hypothetical protein